MSDEMDDTIAGPGHNQPPPEEKKGFFDDLDEEKSPADLAIDRGKTALAKATLAYKKGPAKTQDEVDAAEGFVRQVSDSAKALDEIRVTEKRPHDEAAKAVQEKYAPLIKTLKDAAAALKKQRIEPFLIEQERIRRAEEQRAREAAEKAEREAAEKAAAAEEGDFVARQEAELAAGKAKEATKAARTVASTKTGAKHGTSTRATSLRKVKKGVITNISKFLAANIQNPVLIEACQRIADEKARQNIECDGMTIKEEEKAV